MTQPISRRRALATLGARWIAGAADVARPRSATAQALGVHETVGDALKRVFGGRADEGRRRRHQARPAADRRERPGDIKAISRSGLADQPRSAPMVGEDAGCVKGKGLAPSRQLRHPVYRKPELLATGPNQVWSWDITKLLGPVKWTYYYLYVLLDIFSRCVVGWPLGRHESAALAKMLIAESCDCQHIAPDQLTIHADRGPTMTSQPVALLLATLGVVPSYSRPQVSDVTTPSPRPSSRPSSIDRTSRRGSGPTRTPRRSASGSSSGTTPSTATAPSA